MIQIPLSFSAMWLIMFLGIVTNMLVKINYINQKSSEEILWTTILKKFIRKEWASYLVSIVFTGVVAYSFVYMKQFERIDNAEISRWAKWIPLAVIILYGFGILNQWVFYRYLGRIQSKGQIDEEILKEGKN